MAIWHCLLVATARLLRLVTTGGNLAVPPDSYCQVAEAVYSERDLAACT